MDVQVWLLIGEIDGEHYVSLKIVVCQPENSLYVSQHAPQLWYDNLEERIERFGFRQHSSWECVFAFENQQFEVAILVHDDCLDIPGSKED